MTELIRSETKTRHTAAVGVTDGTGRHRPHSPHRRRSLGAERPVHTTYARAMVRWLTGFIDMPADVFEAGTQFWEQVSGTNRSAPRGATGQFATLLPSSGEAFLRVQRIDDGPARLHIDVHVDDVDAATRRAVQLGGSVVADHGLGYVTCDSPGGFCFCLVAHHAESNRPVPVTTPGLGTSLVDQVALDMPAELANEEIIFWSALVGFEHHRSARAEYDVLVRPPEMPLRLLGHRLGAEDVRQATSAHLDLACGADVARLAEHHKGLGAELERVDTHWTTLRDPAGLRYCLTARDPFTGTLPTS